MVFLLSNYQFTRTTCTHEVQSITCFKCHKHFSSYLHVVLCNAISVFGMIGRFITVLVSVIMYYNQYSSGKDSSIFFFNGSTKSLCKALNLVINDFPVMMSLTP